MYVVLLPFIVKFISAYVEAEEGFLSDTVSFEGRDFTFHEQRLSWSEAASLCRSMGGNLATVNTLQVAQFLVNAQNSFPQGRLYEDVWIGGRFRNGKWFWRSTGERFPSVEGEDGYPPWVKISRKRHNCLLLDRYEYTLPLFVDRECGSLRSFVCEKVREEEVVSTDSFEVDGFKYHMFREAIIWDKAVAACRDNDSSLAVVSDLQEAKFLASSLASSNLNVHRVWLGGRLEEGTWEWLISGDEIPSVVEEDGYPPWQNGEAPLFGQECLMLDHGGGTEPHFVSDNCMSLQSFVCKKASSGQSVAKLTLKFHGYEYLLFSQKVSWEVAVERCKSEDAELATVDNMVTAQFIVKSMSESLESLHMIWLGANQSFNKNWKWLATDEELVSTSDEVTGYPPWRLPPTQRESKCLALERSVHDQPYFLQRRCDIPQGFLCQRDLVPNEPVVMDVVIGNRTFRVHEKSETWEQAVSVCKSENSHLAVLRNSDEMFMLSNVSTIRRLWLDGHWIKDKWVWMHLDEPIPETYEESKYLMWSKKPREKPDYDCLYVDMRHPKRPNLRGQSCSKDLGFICEKILKTEETYNFKGISYVVYSERVTWAEAAAICNSKGYYLAMATNLEEAEFLSRLTREYHELWIGGTAHNKTWEWERTKKKIPSIPQQNGYPPWAHPLYKAEHNCLTIERNSLGKPLFIQTRCTMTQGFVCEKGGEKINEVMEPLVFTQNERVYMFYPELLTWQEAFENCQKHGAYLALLPVYDTVQFAAEHIANFPEIWIGGKKIGDKWYWISSEEEIYQDYVPWSYLHPQHDCLTINRRHQGEPFFLGLLCNQSRPYICERADRQKKNYVEIMKLPDRDLIFVEARHTFNEARAACSIYNGRLAVLDTSELFDAAAKFSGKFQGLWVGATSDLGGVARWLHTGQQVSLILDQAIKLRKKVHEIHLSNYDLNSDFLKDTSNGKTKADMKMLLRKKRGLHNYEVNYTSDETAYDSYFVPITAEFSQSTNSLEVSTGSVDIDKFDIPSSTISQEYDIPSSTISQEFSIPSSTISQQYDIPSSTVSQEFGIPSSTISQEYDIPSSTISQEFGIPSSTTSHEFDILSSTVSQEFGIPSSTISQEFDIPSSTISQEFDIPSSTISKEEGTVQTTFLYVDQHRDEMPEHLLKMNTQLDASKTALPRTTGESTSYRFYSTMKNLRGKKDIPIETIFTSKTTEEEVFTATEESEFAMSEKELFLIPPSLIQDEDNNSHKTQDNETDADRIVGPDQQIDVSIGNEQNFRSLTSQGYNLINKIKCIKFSHSGTLMELPCHTKHSFLCERRTNATEPVTTIVQHEGHVYLTSTEKVTWEKAFKLCQTYHGYLASLTTESEVNLFATISPDFQDLWIGGHLKDEDTWEWKHTGILLSMSSGYGNSSLWVNIPSRPGHNCLNLYRKAFGKAAFLDRKCNELHGFICEDVPHSNVTMVESYQLDGRTFGFYKKRLNWNDAVEVCASQEGVLAAFKNEQEISMLKSVKTAFHDLWVGGHVHNSVWYWVQDNERIQGIKVNTSGYENGEVNSTLTMNELLHEPANWKYGETQVGSDCAMVYRESEQDAFLLGKNCNSRHDFVCEFAHNHTLNFRGQHYTIFLKHANWMQAKDICADHGQYLTVIDDKDEAIFLAGVSEVFSKMWVGAHRNAESSEEWIWDHTGEAVHFDLVSEQNQPVVNLELSEDKRCLSIGWSKSFNKIFVHNNCDSILAFVCEGTGYSTETLIKSYQFGDKQLTFHKQYVTWDDAMDICLSRGEHLAVVDTPELARFIEQNVSKEFHDLWVDGRLENNTAWIWSHTNKSIHIVHPFTKSTLPSWIHVPSRLDHNCLNLYQHGGFSVKFLDRKCDEKFGFICEESSINKELVQSFKYKGRVYTYYSKKVNWYNANEICHKNGTYLAIINSKMEAEFLTKLGGKFLTTWIGARVLGNNYVWNHTRELFPMKSNTNEFFMYDIKNDDTSGDGCIGIGTFGARVLFIERNCEAEHTFICEDYGDKGETHEITYKYRNQLYTLSTSKKTWEKANEYCMNNGSYLAVINSNKEFSLLSKIAPRFHDIWIGGHNYDGPWLWEHTNEPLLNSNSGSGNLSVPWIKTSQYHSPSNNGNKCLNVYRPTASESSFIGHPCERKFGFMCESFPGTSKPVVKQVIYNGRKYVLHNMLVTWSKAASLCKMNGSYLAILTDMKEAKAIASAGIRFHDLWIGGQVKDYHWEWEHTGQRLPSHINAETGFPPWVNVPQQPNHKCLNLYNGNGSPQFIDRWCEEFHGFVCEEVGLRADTQLLGHFGGHRYVFVGKRVPWKVAVDTCRAMHGYLVIPSENDELKFLTNKIDFHDSWVDGHVSNSRWEWEHTGQRVIPPVRAGSTGLDIVKGLVPQWVRFPTRPMHNCLVVYRDSNNEPYLLDCPCSNLHSFVCEEVPEKYQRGIEMKSYSNKKYALVYEHVSWDEAVHVCKEKGGYLAIPDDNDEATFFASVSPDLHDIWVGGAREHGGPWQWIHTEQKIDFSIPWTSLRIQPTHNCINMYRDKLNKPMFVARRCSQHFGFICEDITDADPTTKLILFRGRSYLFSNEAKTWQESVDVCKSHGGYLAIVGDSSESDFIGAANTNFHDIWVGGSRITTPWEWRHTHQRIPDAGSSLESYGRNTYPPWINNGTRVGHDCINIYRGTGNKSFFVDRKCDEKHSFVCEEVEDIQEDIEEVKLYNGRVYKFYSKEVSWEKALDICKDSSSYLAIISEEKEANFIAKAGKDFHDLWVGGRQIGDRWEWDHTGQPINLKNGRLPLTNVLEVDACLNIYRNDENNAIFVDRNCNELHGFVCEEAAVPEVPNKVLEFNGNVFIFTSKHLNWNEAYDTCKNNGSTLPIVLDLQTAQFLASVGKEYHDIWLGGYWEYEYWSWKPKELHIPTEPGDDGFPTWIRNVTRLHHDCLSLYRDIEDYPFLLDTRCDEKRFVVCQKYNNKLGSFLNTFTYDNQHYTFVHHPESWSDAEQICHRNGSFLSIINDRLTAKAIAEHIYDVPGIWIGGRFHEHFWFWELIGEMIPLPELKNGYPLWVQSSDHEYHECLLLDVQEGAEPRFVREDCNVARPFICVKGCPPISHVLQGSWSRDECKTRVNIQGEECEFKCQEALEQWGSKKLVCNNGWKGVPPQCVSAERMAQTFVDHLNTTVNIALQYGQYKQDFGVGIMFLISKTRRIGAHNYRNVAEFIKAVAGAIRLVPGQVSSGVITYGMEAVLEIPLNMSNTCDFIDFVDQMMYDNPGDKIGLQQALLLAQDYIENGEPFGQKILVLILHEDSIKDTSEVIGRLKNIGYKIFVIGIGNLVSAVTLEEMASEPVMSFGTAPNFYKVSTYQAFGRIVSYLNTTYLYNSDLECCFTLQTPINGFWHPQYCTEGPGELNDSCIMSCKEGFDVVGDRTLTCSKQGWQGTMGKGNFPSCNAISVNEEYVHRRITEVAQLSDKVAMLFIIDQSNIAHAEDFKKHRDFVRMIVSTFSLSSERTAGLITFRTKVSVAVPIYTANTCHFLISLDQLQFERNGTSYQDVQQVVEEELTEIDEGTTVLIFLITDNLHNTYIRLMENQLQKKGHIVFTIGDYKKSQLKYLSLIGERDSDEHPNYFAVDDQELIRHTVFYINNTYTRSSEEYCCTQLDSNIPGIWEPSSCVFSSSLAGTTCTLNCDIGYEIHGSSQLTCLPLGWDSLNSTCVVNPLLLGKSLINQLRELVKSNSKVLTIVFVVDGTNRLVADMFPKVTDLIKLIISKFPLSNELRAGLVVNGNHGVTMDVSVQTSDSCEFFEALTKLKYSNGSTSLRNSLKFLIKLSNKYNADNHSMVVVFLTDHKRILRSSLSLVNRLKMSGNKVFVIGIENRNVYDDLEILASSDRYSSNLFVFNAYDAIDRVTEVMMTEKEKQHWYTETGYNTPSC